MRDMQTWGIFWFIVHCLCFSLISVITKQLMDHLPLFEIIFFQTCFGSILLLVYILPTFKASFTLQHTYMHASRALLWVLATVMYFYAVQYVVLAKAVAVSFSVPLFTSLMAVVWLKERLYGRRMLALVIGVVGMLIVIQPGIRGYEPETLWVVGASFLWSITDIMIKILGRTYHPVVQTFYFSIFSALCCLPIALLYWKMPNVQDMVWLGLLAAVFVVNIITVSKSYQQADLTVLMPFAFTQLVFSALMAYGMFGEVMTMTTLIGASIILASTSYMTYMERKKMRVAMTH